MGLDIRLPIGLMFSLIGAMLVIYGAVAAEKSRSLGMNVNLIWGSCILGFGVVMLLAWRFYRRPPPPPSADTPAPASDRPRGGH